MFFHSYIFKVLPAVINMAGKRKVKGKAKKTLLTGKHFMLLFFIISFIFMFAKLDDIYLRSDESDTALFGKNTLKFGYPKAYNGENWIPTPYVPEVGFITETDYYNKDLAIVSHSWLQYYLEALSFGLFGYSTFAARVLFTIFGFFSLFLINNLYKKLYPDKKITRLALLILFAMVFFYMFCMQARYYPLVVFFTAGLLINYINILKRDKTKDIILFSVCGAFLFHSNYLIFGVTFISLFIHFILCTKWKAKLKSMILACAFIALLTLPWFLYAQPWKFVKGGRIFGMLSLFEMYMFITQTINFHYPIILLIFLPVLLYKLNKKSKKQKDYSFSDKFLFVFILVPLLFFCFLSPLKSYRFVFNLSPLFFLFCSRLFYICSEKTKAIKTIAVIMLILLLTSNILPFVPAFVINSISKAPMTNLCHKFAPAEKQEICNDFVESSIRLGEIKFPIFYYLYELTHSYVGTDEGIIKYLNENAKKNDTIWAYPYLYTAQFYTGMRIYDITEYEKYLNNTEVKPDWIVYSWKEGNLAQSLKEYAEKYNYAAIELSCPELYAENRPDLHLHRFWTDNDAPRKIIYRSPDYK